MHTEPIWYVLATPVIIVGVMFIALGLYACWILIAEQRSPFEQAPLTIPRIWAGAASFVTIGALCEVIAMKIIS